MNATTYFRAQAYNNAWSNHRLLDACRLLPARELAARRTSFFPTIIHTLNHILTVDRYYLSGLEGTSLGTAAFDPEVPHPDIAALSAEQRRADRGLIDFCERLTDDKLMERVDHQRTDWVQTERIDRTLLHLFAHQTHHRGQVHAMLAGTAVPPPQLDEFFLDHERERALRSEDFETLGFAEDRIWR